MRLRIFPPTALDHDGVIAILPERPFPFLPKVVELRKIPFQRLHEPRQGLGGMVTDPKQQMCVVRSNAVVQQGDAEARQALPHHASILLSVDAPPPGGYGGTGWRTERGRTGYGNDA